MPARTGRRRLRRRTVLGRTPPAMTAARRSTRRPRPAGGQKPSSGQPCRRRRPTRPASASRRSGTRRGPRCRRSGRPRSGRRPPRRLWRRSHRLARTQPPREVEPCFSAPSPPPARSNATASAHRTAIGSPSNRRPPDGRGTGLLRRPMNPRRSYAVEPMAAALRAHAGALAPPLEVEHRAAFGGATKRRCARAGARVASRPFADVAPRPPFLPSVYGDQP